MATRFLSQRDRNTFTTINRELVGSPKDSKDGVVNQTCVLYRISAADTIISDILGNLTQIFDIYSLSSTN